MKPCGWRPAAPAAVDCARASSVTVRNIQPSATPLLLPVLLRGELGGAWNPRSPKASSVGRTVGRELHPGRGGG
eukprot:779917-Prymnesium_polylepis.1